MFHFVLAVLATWRVTHLLASEDGPGDVVVRLRARLGTSLLGRMIDCFHCLSLWIAAAFAVFVSMQWDEWLLAWLALSGGACLLERLGDEPVVIQQFSESAEEKKMCCGQKRSQWRATPSPVAVQVALPEVAPDASAKMVMMRCVGTLPVRVAGLRTGRFYEFTPSQPVQAIDVQDVASLLGTRLFRRA